MNKEEKKYYTCEDHKRLMAEDLTGHNGILTRKDTDATLIIDKDLCEYCLVYPKYPKCLTCFQYEKTGKHYKDCPFNPKG